MGIVLTNALLVDLDPPNVELTSLRIDHGMIVERGRNVDANDADEVIDCGGCMVLPGLVNGHTHLYSALASGMPAPGESITNFHDVLKYVWWRLDRALDGDAVEMSALVGAVHAIRCGTTTLIDHHASPSCISESLDRVENGIDRVGLRAVLCYETTDRNGTAGREAGLAENRRFLEKCSKSGDHKFAGLVGGHACFTLDDASLASMADQAEKFDTGVHLHVAEDPVDDAICRERYGHSLLDRLNKHNLITSRAVFAHGTHLPDDAIAQFNQTRPALAHNPRSNMNNAVGYTRIGDISCPIMLGTDGIGADMFTEAHVAWLKSRDGSAGQSPAQIVSMLVASARRASQALGVQLGSLQPDHAADIVITDFLPATPLDAENVVAQFIFAFSSQHVRHVIARGEWAMRDRMIASVDESAVRIEAQDVARSIWSRMQSLD